MRMMTRLLPLTLVFALFSARAFAQQPVPAGATPVTQTTTLLTAAQAVAHSHATGVTLTITVPAGMFAYITGLDISDCEGTALTAAAPTYITTTGINGSPQYQIGSGPAVAGTCSPTIAGIGTQPLKSQTAGTNVTFVLPTFVTNQVVSLNVYYYLGF